MKTKWYYSSWIILPLLVILPPVGLTLLLVGRRYKLYIRTPLAAIGFVLTIFMFLNKREIDKQNVANNVSQPTTVSANSEPSPPREVTQQTKADLIKAAKSYINEKVEILPVPKHPGQEMAVVTYGERGTTQLKSSILYDAIDLGKAVFTDPRLKSIQYLVIQPQVSFLDVYGNPHMDNIAKIQIDRDAAERISWENITPELFTQLLTLRGEIWLHPKIE